MLGKLRDYGTDPFTEDSVLNDAVEIVAGNLTFHGLTFAASWEEISPAHCNFLQIYNRLRPLKSAEHV